MGFQNLTDVHTARNAQRIQDDVHRSSVGQERHIFFWQDLGNNPFVPVATGHLIADRNLTFRCHIDLDHLKNAGRKFIASLHRVELAVTNVDCFFNRSPMLFNDLLTF